MITDTASNVYGTTEQGGEPGCIGQNGCGTVFKIAPDGTETVLYAFIGAIDGGNPAAGLVLDNKGNLYGTTIYGGSCDVYGCGTIFKITADGKEKVLHSFAGNSDDGGNPYAGLLRDKSGNLYGTTTTGGFYGRGVTFELTKHGTETVLYSFITGSSYAGLIADSEGNFYGTTEGGADDRGTVFKLTADGTETTLYSFTGGNDGGPYLAAS